MGGPVCILLGSAVVTLTLRQRLFIAYSLVITAALAFVTIVGARQVRSWLVRRDGDTLEHVAHFVRAEVEEDRAWASLGWQRAAHTLGASLTYRVTLIGRDGRILGDSGEETGGDATGRPEVHGALAGRPVRAFGPGPGGVAFLYVAIPGRERGPVAVVRVGEPLSELQRRGNRMVLLSAATALGTLAVFVWVMFWLTGRHAARIAELERIAQRLGRGELAARARETPNDDVGRLGQAMNRMAGRLTERLEAIENANRMQRDFVANVSHELRTPLTSVVGYAETLLDGAIEDAAHRRRFVEVIHEQGRRLQSLATDLLALADLERPDLRLRYETIDLRELLDSHVDAMRARAARAGLALECHTGAPVEVDVDPARMGQVVTNLLDNALGYTAHGSVTVTCGADGETVWFAVADTGPGIDDDDRARIFERFYRVDPARTGRTGTGLGLAIVQHLVTLHGGTIDVESRVGEGSTFRVRLPRRAARHSAQEDPA